MSSLGIAGMVLILLAVGIGLLNLDKIIKIAFGSWVLLGLSLGIGIALRKSADFLQEGPDLLILGMKHQSIADFLIAAQPTLMLVISGLLLWFFLGYGQLHLAKSEDLFQKFIWAILAVGSLFSMVWLSLFTVGGSLYQWLFLQGDLASYAGWFPVIVIIIALCVLLFASKVNIKLSFNASISE